VEQKFAYSIALVQSNVELTPLTNVMYYGLHGALFLKIELFIAKVEENAKSYFKKNDN
jgi:hypothetical protein